MGSKGVGATKGGNQGGGAIWIRICHGGGAPGRVVCALCNVQRLCNLQKNPAFAKLPPHTQMRGTTVGALLLAFALPVSSLLSLNASTVEGLPSSRAFVDLPYVPNPVFGWRVSGGPQTHFHLRVAADPAFTTLLWDSGPLPSSSSSQHPYGGPPLPFSAGLYWSVAASSDGGATFSQPLISPLQTAPDGWAWASHTSANGGWLASCTQGAASPSLRLSFSLSPAPITRAVAYATALGVYSLHLNGARAGGGRDAVLTPGWATVPTWRLSADAYDVTANLSAGSENVLGMRLGQGKVGYNREFCDAGDASCYGGVVMLIVEQQGGNVTILDGTAPGWECAPSPISFNSLFGGETYDARLEARGWDRPGFLPPAGPWPPAPRLRNATVAVFSFGPPAMAVIADVPPVSVAYFGGGATPYVPPPSAKGMFVKSNDDVNVWWAVTDPSPQKWFVSACSPCSGVDACGSLIPETDAWINALPTAPVNFSCSLLPVKGMGAWQFDMGKNMAGFCTLTVPPGLAENSSLALVHGEILDPSGKVDNTFGSSDGTRRCPAPSGINCADQTDIWVAGSSGGSSNETFAFTPTFTFHGFRHIALMGWPDAPFAPPTLDTLKCHVVSTAMEDAGSAAFPAGSVLNALQGAVKRTQRSNMFSVPSDCPTRLVAAGVP